MTGAVELCPVATAVEKGRVGGPKSERLDRGVVVRYLMIERRAGPGIESSLTPGRAGGENQHRKKKSCQRVQKKMFQEMPPDRDAAGWTPTCLAS